MVIFVILALLLGIFYGQSGLAIRAIDMIHEHSEIILYLLMFSVGISVGGNQTVFKRLKNMDARVWLLPAGVVLGSLIGGGICILLNDLSVWENLSVASGLGWYSLSGVLLSDFFGADAGAIAFISNLMREFFSFLTIPLIAKYLNSYAAISVAGATSEDTTLPIIMRSTSEEMVVYAVINGVITSALVPLLIRALYMMSTLF